MDNSRVVLPERQAQQAASENRLRTRVLLAALLALWGIPSVYAWGGKTALVRKYRPGQRMVYQTTMQTQATVRSNPDGLRAFLPPLPTELSTRQQNTVTIKAVQPDGTAEVENRFDRFEFQSNLPELLPEDYRDSARAAQEEFSKRVSGHAVTARYGRDGRLVGFEGTEEMLQELDAQLRETARQLLRVFLEQMGGNALYPDHRVRKGEEWKQKLNGEPSESYPFAVEGETTLRFVGKTRYRGIRAAIVDFQFTNLLRPSMETLRRAGPLGLLEAQGMELDIRINGWGEGRALVALDDGRILQNRATLQQTLHARLEGASQARLAVQGPVTLAVDSQTRLEMDGIDAKGQ